MDRKAEEEPIAELWATTTTPQAARPAAAQQAGLSMGHVLARSLPESSAVDREGVGDPACGLLRPYRE